MERRWRDLTRCPDAHLGASQGDWVELSLKRKGVYPSSHTNFAETALGAEGALVAAAASPADASARKYPDGRSSSPCSSGSGQIARSGGNAYTLIPIWPVCGLLADEEFTSEKRSATSGHRHGPCSYRTIGAEARTQLSIRRFPPERFEIRSSFAAAGCHQNRHSETRDTDHRADMRGVDAEGFPPERAGRARENSTKLYLRLDFRPVAFGPVRAIVSVEPLIRRLA